MNGRENNKIAAGILIAGLLVLVTGKIVDILYEPNLAPIHRGYSIAIQEVNLDAQPIQAEPVFNIDIATLLKTASADAGKGVFSRCAACHTDTKGGPNRVGPNLWEIVGRAKGSHEGYTYSNTLKTAGGDWDYESIAKFVHKPAAFFKGTKMTFAGLSNPQDIANVIAYLRTLSDSPKPLP